MIKYNGFFEDVVIFFFKGKELGVYWEFLYVDKFYYGIFLKEFVWGVFILVY